MTPARFLLLGQRPDVMRHLLTEAQAAGLNVRGSTDLAAAPQQFDARQLDVIGFGGGLQDAERQRLRTAFWIQNPAVQFVDLVAPTAVHQLESAAAGRLGTVIEDVELVPAEFGELLVRWHTSRPAFGSLTLYHYDGGPHRTVLTAGPLPAGEQEWFVDEAALGTGPNFLVVQADDDLASVRVGG